MDIKRFLLIFALLIALASTACSMPAETKQPPTPVHSGGLTAVIRCGNRLSCPDKKGPGDGGSPTPVPNVPVHDPGDWTHIVYLTCAALESYEWTWNGASSGEYSALTPIEGVTRATIVYSEYNPLCPGFQPHLKVPIHNRDGGGILGYQECSEVTGLSWFWYFPGGGWTSSTPLFGSDLAGVESTELAMNCPGAALAKVVPVHGVTWERIGFLTCIQLDDYTWALGGSSGEYIATTVLFGSSQATIRYEEYFPACPTFTP
jgi:hypothetical protein